MSEPLFFQMPDLQDNQLKELFALLMPTYIDTSCIACAFYHQKPLAIIATNNSSLSEVLRNFADGVKELSRADIPAAQYHLSGDQSLWTLAQSPAVQ